MNTNILIKAKAIIRHRKEQAESNAYDKLATLRRVQSFADAESSLAGLMFEKAKLVSLSKDYSHLNNDILNAEKQFDAELKKAGFKREDLLPQYNCKKCNDKGQINNKMCSCLKNEINRLLSSLYEDVGVVEDDFSKIDFSVFGENRMLIKKNYFVIKEICDAYPKLSKNMICVCGGVGVGKSYMASVFSSVLQKKEEDVIFISAIKINQMFLEYHLAPLEEKTAILSPIFSVDVLIIDDLGSETFLNNVTINYLYQLIINRNKKLTMITTNLAPEQVKERYDQRVYSRLSDKNKSLWLHFKGKDLRITGK